MPSFSALTRPPYQRLPHERKATQRRNSIGFDAVLIVSQAKHAYASDPRLALPRRIFDAFADYTEGWPRPQRDRLWVAIQSLLVQSDDRGARAAG
jgi:hypothetical protein